MSSSALRLLLLVSFTPLVIAPRASGADGADLNPDRPLYTPAGRRDPFLRGTTLRASSRPCAGLTLRGQLVAEVALRGIVTTRTGKVAFLASADGRAYFARVGDRLCDGSVTAIDAESATFAAADADDLTGLKQRLVRKSLAQP